MDEWINLYHRTTRESAAQIAIDKTMVSRESPAFVYFSTHRDGQAFGHGPAVVRVRVPRDIARLDDEFPDGEQHYAVLADALRPEHFIGLEPDAEPLTCLDEHTGGCEGNVELRMSLSPTGIPYPRCDRHWSRRLDVQEGINERYPQHAPADFDPLYAGESWDED